MKSIDEALDLGDGVSVATFGATMDAAEAKLKAYNQKLSEADTLANELDALDKDLKALSREGKFRDDLYYRLAEIVVNVPPLRARAGDAALLAHAFVRRFSLEQKRPTMTLSQEAVRAVELHSWPGNIRELENCIRRAVIMADSSQISCDDVGLQGLPEVEGESSLDLRVIRDNAEKAAIGIALGRVNGNMVKAAELLGVSRPTLYDLMHRLGLK